MTHIWLLLALLPAIFCTKERYDGFEVIRISCESPSDFASIHSIAEKELLDVWATNKSGEVGRRYDSF